MPESNRPSNQEISHCEHGLNFWSCCNCMSREIDNLRDAATIALSELQTVEREIIGLAPEARSKAIPLLLELVKAHRPGCWKLQTENGACNCGAEVTQ
jgi:hypothetical protein